MVVMLLPLVVPPLVVAGWLGALRWPGPPRRMLAGCCAALPVVCLVAGAIAGGAEDRGLPAGCRDGTVAGLECGFGLARFAGYLAAAAGVVTLAVLTAITVIVWVVRRRSYRGLPALTSDGS